MLASRENLPLLAELLAEQQRLDTPVARFSAAHDAHSSSPPSAPNSELPGLRPQLIPFSQPQPGEHYAFEVDLDSCTGCKSCVAACHALNGLDETETWRDVGVLVSPSRARPFTQTITTACHHCADPACLNGCPVLAYEKDPITGIVRHLDDQCIGCSYCILKCPYDAPKFSERLGIVRKCDMCHGRLAAGEAPACAQACPTHAIRIVTISNLASDVGREEQVDGEPPREKRDGSVLARHSAPALPSGVSREYPDFGFGLDLELAASDSRAETTNSSYPSPVSAVRSPVSASPPAVSGPLRPFLPGAPDPGYTRPTTRYVSKRVLPENLVAGDAAKLRPQPPHWPLVFMLTLLPAAIGLACAAAFFHHQPETRGLTFHVSVSSWLAGMVGLAASVFHLGRPLRAWRIFLGWRTSWLSREALVFGAWLPLASAALIEPAFVTPSAVLGLAGLACSAMIYIDTRRHFWRAAQTAPRLFGTAALFGLAAFVPLGAAGLLGAKLAWEWRTCFDQSVSARLQKGPLARAVLARDGLAAITLVLLVVAPGWAALLSLFAGELAERYLFFRAVDAPKMPGLTP